MRKIVTPKVTETMVVAERVRTREQSAYMRKVLSREDLFRVREVLRAERVAERVSRMADRETLAAHRLAEVAARKAAHEQRRAEVAARKAAKAARAAARAAAKAAKAAK